MIVLDTNVLSEVLRPAPSPVVARWFAAQEPSAVWTTAITQAELLFGIELLPAGRRRTGLLAAAERIMIEEFAGRILPFDEDAAREFASIAASRHRAGHAISQADGMIAAIARCRGWAVATRNTNDFEGCGVKLINPWIE